MPHPHRSVSPAPPSCSVSDSIPLVLIILVDRAQGSWAAGGGKILSSAPAGPERGRFATRRNQGKRQEIDEAIKQIQAGKSVSPEEIDRILGETSVDRYE